MDRLALPFDLGRCRYSVSPVLTTTAPRQFTAGSRTSSPFSERTATIATDGPTPAHLPPGAFSRGCPYSLYRSPPFATWTADGEGYLPTWFKTPAGQAATARLKFLVIDSLLPCRDLNNQTGAHTTRWLPPRIVPAGLGRTLDGQPERTGRPGFSTCSYLRLLPDPPLNWTGLPRHWPALACWVSIHLVEYSVQFWWDRCTNYFPLHALPGWCFFVSTFGRCAF